MTQVDMQVPFTLVTCDRCGRARAAGASCPHCGSTTTFDDPAVDLRRRVVAQVLKPDETSKRSRRSIEPSEVFRGLANWSTPFMRACAQIMEGSEEEAADRITVVVGHLREIQERVMRTKRARNEAAVWSTIDGVLGSFHSVMDEYLAALTTADPTACRAHAGAAQQGLDAAGQIAAALGPQLESRAREDDGFVRGLLIGALGGWFLGRGRH